MQHGNTAIHEAAWNGYSLTLQELVFAKANVNAINNVRQQQSSRLSNRNSAVIHNKPVVFVAEAARSHMPMLALYLHGRG